MLTGLAIRDVVLIETLDLGFQPGLTALTGETGAGKSIVLDSLGLASGARADAGLVRSGARQAGASALFAPPVDHPIWAALAERGIDADPLEDLVLRRQLGADGRSRAWINDQPAAIGALRDAAASLLEVHGQHEAAGLLDARTHRGLLDAFGGLSSLTDAAAAAWRAWSAAKEEAERLRSQAQTAAAEAETLREQVEDLDRLDPREGEEAALAEERALLSASEKALADIAAARSDIGGEALAGRAAQSLRALERARDRVLSSGVGAESAAVQRLAEAVAALDRVLVEAEEAAAAVDRAAETFDFEPDRLEKAEERLFALRAAARRLDVAVDLLPMERARLRDALHALDSGGERLAEAERAASDAEASYVAAAAVLSAARRSAAAALTAAVQSELPPLKLEKVRFEASVEELPPERHGPAGADRVVFQVATVPGAPLAPLDAVASGGELARLALALKVSLAGAGATPVMIFDEVDQGVGGAVADAVGLRLKRLAETAQILVVTHSPQIAARADQHWRVSKSDASGALRTTVEPLEGDAREEEIARMLSGAEITAEARAAARALLAG